MLQQELLDNSVHIQIILDERIYTHTLEKSLLTIEN